AATDVAGNSSGTSSFSVSVDNSAPTLSTLQMFDTDHNGRVDQVQATFNETLANSTATSPWTLTAAPSGAALASVGTSSTVATGSGDGTLGLNLVDDDSIAASSTNKLGGTGTGNGSFTGPTYTIDKSAPQLTSLVMLDSNGNGKADHVQTTFNETIQTSTA